MLGITWVVDWRLEIEESLADEGRSGRSADRDVRSGGVS